MGRQSLDTTWINKLGVLLNFPALADKFLLQKKSYYRECQQRMFTVSLRTHLVYFKWQISAGPQSQHGQKQTTQGLRTCYEHWKLTQGFLSGKAKSGIAIQVTEDKGKRKGCSWAQSCGRTRFHAPAAAVHGRTGESAEKWEGDGRDGESSCWFWVRMYSTNPHFSVTSTRCHYRPTELLRL